jgi:putative DNA primase/helicase
VNNESNDTEVADAYDSYREYENSANESLLSTYDSQPKPEKIILAGTSPKTTADAVLGNYGEKHIARWRGNWYEYDGSSYRKNPDERMALLARRAMWKCIAPEIVKKEPTDNLIPIPVKISTVNETVASIIAHDGVSLGDSRDAPMWRSPGPHGNRADDCLPMLNGVFDTKTGEFLGKQPDLFFIGHTPYAYNPNAGVATRWLEFLDCILGNDPDSIRCLQEWMGYLLSSECDHHKMLYIFGPKRAGKGIIASIMAALIGSSMTTNPTLDQLSGDFGYQPLLGKRHAIIGDARFVGQKIPTACERLLNLSANDKVQVSRKNIGESVEMRLGCRITIMSNDLPKFKDDSGTIMSRFVYLELTKSFYGSEDLGLTKRILEEMPQIFLWAHEGLLRLRSQGYFTSPACNAEIYEEMRESAAPVRSYASERLVISPDEGWEESKFVYSDYRKWCVENENGFPVSAETFGRQLKSMGIQKQRLREDGTRIYKYLGVRVKGLLV